MRRVPWATAVALLAVPAAIAAAHAWTARSVTPLWMGGSADPTYPYVLNALLVAEGRPPADGHTPGIPLEVLGAVVLHATHALSGSPLGLRDHVLSDPERFVAPFRTVLLCLFFLADVLQGWAAYRLTGSLACAAAAQAAPLASFLGSRTMLTVMCEPLLLALGLVLSAWTLLVLDREPPAPRARDALTAGVVVGLGVAVRLLFAPVALLPLLVLQERRHRLAFVAWSLLFFALGIAPFWPHLGALVAWVASSLSHTGLATGGYGQGPAGFVDPGLLAAVFVQFLRGEAVTYTMTAVALATAVALRGRTPPSARPVRRALLVAVGIQVLILVQSAKTMGPHHLMSAVSLAGLVVALTHRLVVLALPGRSRLPAAASALVFALLVCRHAWLVRSYLDFRGPVRPGARAAAAEADRFGQDRVVQGYCVSTLASNLAMAHELTWRAFGADLERLYPHAVFFDWAGIHHFGRPVTVREMEARLVDGDALVVWDTLLYPQEVFGFFRGLRMTELGRWGRDRMMRGSLAPLRAGTASEEGAPPFAGVLILGPSVGTDRPAPGRLLRDLVPLGPVTRLALLGNGEALRLVAENRYEDQGGQVLSFEMDGEVVGRQTLAGGEGWQRTVIELPPRSGLLELAVHYDRLWTSEDAARPTFPGYGARYPEVRWPAVRYRKLQVWASGSTDGEIPGASRRTAGGSIATHGESRRER